ncbi:hypothetical protein PoMZ_02565 [Pyricularia oryzae]|uniref:Uncharacterized protein n=1 Tax=Pyricularia oryzae TaxID=318829 RepID=A0A4P7N7L2_PYROR|nr:hypothetical protein PoMZ_02565 [Pyricularia oryzae]
MCGCMRGKPALPVLRAARPAFSQLCKGPPFPRFGARPQFDLKAWGGKLRGSALHGDNGSYGADQASATVQ